VAGSLPPPSGGSVTKPNIPGWFEMSDLKKELAQIGRAFDFAEVPTFQKVICPYYRRASFGMLRCMGSTIAGKCGHPAMICPIPPMPSSKAVKLSEIIEVE